MAIQTVVIAIHEGVQALDVAGPVDVFNEANNFLATEDRYETALVAAHLNPICASNKMQLIADQTFDEATGKFDILLVAGGPTLPNDEPDVRLLNWVKQAPRCAQIYGSICTGAFTLGHAGLLDKRRVTTHWQHVHTLAERFPRARVEPDAIYTRDGRLVTSAGITAGIDLALALVLEQYGPEVAVMVAKRLVVVAQRQGGQSQFSPYLTAAFESTSQIERIKTIITNNIGARHTLQSLAQDVGMSPRNLARYFVQITGITPHEFVLRLRIDSARMLLERSNRPLKTIAYECGLGTADQMRKVFQKRLGVTPTLHRANFRHASGEFNSDG